MFHSKYDLLRDINNRETTKPQRYSLRKRYHKQQNTTEIQNTNEIPKQNTNEIPKELYSQKIEQVSSIKDSKEISETPTNIESMKKPIKNDNAMKEPINMKANISEHITKTKIKEKFKETKDKKVVLAKRDLKGLHKKLVLAGGGLKGLAYVGAINALRKLRVLDNIDEVVGCSIGAVFALLIVLDYSDDELHDFLLHFHYDQLKDLDFFKIMTEWGVESGSKIETFLIQLIKNKTDLDNPTFLELYKKVGSSLVVNAVALDDYNLYYFGLRESPNMKVVKAIRASISVPGLFTPVRYDNHLFVDGGLLNNFPIDYFKDKGIVGSSILGLCFDQVVRPPGMKNLNGVNAYLSAIMGCVLNRIDKTGESDRKIEYLFGENPKIISIPTGDITAFQATLARTKRLYLYHHGEQAVFKAFEKASNLNKVTHKTLRRSSI